MSSGCGFGLAELWADRTAWPMAHDELAELACMSALAKWPQRWQPIAIHGVILAGAKAEAVAGALGSSPDEAYRCWHEWASRQRDFIIGGEPGVTEDEYEAVARRFASMGIKP